MRPLARLILTIIVVVSLAPSAVLASDFFRSYKIRDITEGSGVYPASDGGYLLTGTSKIFGMCPKPDIFIVKCNSNGQPEWSRLINSIDQLSDPMSIKDGNDYGVAVTELGDGSVITASICEGFMTDQYQATLENPENILLSKFGPGGNHLWSKTIGDLGREYPLALCPTPGNNFLLMGNTTRVYGFPAYQGYDYSDADMFRLVGKYDRNGQPLWVKKTNVKFYSISGIEQTSLFLDDKEGAPLIAFGDIPSPYAPTQKNDLLSLLRFDKEGHLSLVKSFEAPPISAYGGKTLRFSYGGFKAAVPTPDGGYLALGLGTPIKNGQPQIDKQGNICSEIMAVKMDNQGKLLWGKGLILGPFMLGTAWRDLYVARFPDGGLALMGNFLPDSKKGINFGLAQGAKIKEFYQTHKPGEEEKTAESKKLWQAIIKGHDQKSDFYMRNNIMVVKVNGNFNPLWIQTIGGKQDITGSDIKVTPDGGLVIAGTGKVANTNPLAASVYYGVLIKLGPQGEIDDQYLGPDYSAAVSQEDLTSKLVLGNVDGQLEDFSPPTQDRKPKVYVKPVKVW